MLKNEAVCIHLSNPLAITRPKKNKTIFHFQVLKAQKHFNATFPKEVNFTKVIAEQQISKFF